MSVSWTKYLLTDHVGKETDEKRNMQHWTFALKINTWLFKSIKARRSYVTNDIAQATFQTGWSQQNMDHERTLTFQDAPLNSKEY